MPAEEHLRLCPPGCCCMPQQQAPAGLACAAWRLGLLLR